MKLYRFSPIKNKKDLLKAIEFTHFACHKLCKQTFGKYFPNAGNIGIFCHYEDEYEALTKIREEITKASSNWNQKYFELHNPITIPAKGDVPETVYSHLYVRRPDIRSPQVGDVDFYMDESKYETLKKSIQDGKDLPGARIFDRPDLDMIELFDPDIDAIAYISTHKMTEFVRVKQSNHTKL